MIDQKEVDEEIERKIKEMEAESYTFPPCFSKRDYYIVIVVSFICLAGIIGGYYL